MLPGKQVGVFDGLQCVSTCVSASVFLLNGRTVILKTRNNAAVKAITTETDFCCFVQ